METSAETAGRKFAGIEIPPDLKWANFFNLYLASWIMGSLMAIPAVIQPAFLKEIIGIPGNIAGSLNAGLQNIGQIATLLLIGIAGVFSDKYGKRILIVIGFSFCFIFYIIFGHSKDISLYFGISYLDGQLLFVYIIRFFIGIGLVLSHPQFVTIVADYTPLSGRGKGVALHAIMIALGTLCVYGLFTQLAAALGVLGALYTGAFLGFAGIIIAYTGIVDRMHPSGAGKNRVKSSFMAVSDNYALKLTYAAGFITRANLAIPSTILVVWMVSISEQFGYTSLQATARGGLIMMVGSLCSLASFYIIGIILDRIGRIPILIATFAMTGIAYILIATVDNPFSNIMFLYVSLLGFSKNSAIVANNTLASDIAPKELMGSVLGGLNTMGTIGMIFFLQLSGYLFDNISAAIAVPYQGCN